MFIKTRRGFLKNSSALAIGGALTGTNLLAWAKAWAADNPFTPEEGASLRLLRWQRFVESEDVAFNELIAAFTEATGVEVTVESEFMDDIQPKASVAANVGSGPDLIWGLYSTPHLFPDKLVEVTDVATYLGDKYGGWVDSAVTYGTSGDKWICIPLCYNGNMINYRKSMVEQAGFSTFPEDNAGFLELCKALNAQGTPAGMALGHATGDGNAWVHWALWSHGGYLVNENDEVIIDSPETLAACNYVNELYQTFIPGTASWNDGNNNKAFLAGEVSLTNNGISIYQKAVVDGMEMAEDIDHAFWPEGPAGKPTEFHICYPLMAFTYTEYPNACKALMAFILERPQYDEWLMGGVGYLTHPLNAYDDNPVWTEDPKRTIFREAAKRTLTAGHLGSVGEKAAAALAEFIVLDMFASSATGQTSPEEAIQQAARKAERIYRSS
ncbi:MAG: ABC transporter substrate-binding protein [Geminicoccaceae bacterium]